MVREIIHDTEFLAKPSEKAVLPDDIAIADDLLDTLRANADRCVGLAANMIGVAKCVIVFDDNGVYKEMFNPHIVGRTGRYETQEACLSLEGEHPTTRYTTIKVCWTTRQGKNMMRNFTGFTAEIIQHEIDHCKGILI